MSAVTSATPPPCPDCSTVTEQIEVESEEVWRCTAPDCARRTYGTGDGDDDFDLPSYSETDENRAVIIYHGTGDIDFEATSELASQDGPDDQDQDDDAGPAAPLTAPGAPEPMSRLPFRRHELNSGAAAVAHLIGQITF